MRGLGLAQRQQMRTLKVNNTGTLEPPRSSFSFSCFFIIRVSVLKTGFIATDILSET